MKKKREKSMNGSRPERRKYEKQLWDDDKKIETLRSRSHRVNIWPDPCSSKNEFSEEIIDQFAMMMTKILAP